MAETPRKIKIKVEPDFSEFTAAMRKISDSLVSPDPRHVAAHRDNPSRLTRIAWQIGLGLALAVVVLLILTGLGWDR